MSSSSTYDGGTGGGLGVLGVALYLAATLSLVAALIHLLVMPEHFGEWWGYGTFFLAVAVAQLLYVPLLLRRPTLPSFVLGIGGNLAIVSMWLTTRTVGIPFFGPHAWEVEELGALDVGCTLAEVALIVTLAVLLRKFRPLGAVV